MSSITNPETFAPTSLLALSEVAGRSTLRALEPQYADRLLGHATLAQALELAVSFCEDESPRKGEYLLRQFDDFTEAVRSVPGYRGVFGTGYPFYALKEDGGVHTIPEISRYTKSFMPKIAEDAARGYGAWLCGACQVAENLPDLKSRCKPCPRASIKPRDMFKALPDVDFWVVVDTDTTDSSGIAEQAVQEGVGEAGFYTSDVDIVAGIERTIKVMRSLREGDCPSERLPIDLHVVTKNQMIEHLSAVPGAIEAGVPEPIMVRSLHVGWEDTDVPYDFKKDHLFSLTPNDWHDDELVAALETSRQQTKEVVGDRAVEIVAACAPKEARQLESEAIRNCLNRRIQTW